MNVPLRTTPFASKRCWVAVGSAENWKTAFQHGNIWGLHAGRLLEVLWDVLQEGDLLLFYVHKPVGGVVGFGTVKTKFKQHEKPLWPSEVESGKVIYPLRFEFDIEFCLPPQRWAEARTGSAFLKNLVRAGFQPLGQEAVLSIIEELAPSEAERLLRMSPITAVEQTGADTSQTVPLSAHDEAKQMLVEIGRIQKFLAEPEYAVDGGRLDVVWRRVERSVPTYVFEVQVGGDIYHALAKLKHAFDLWNSHIFLVAAAGEKAKLDQLLSGTFHEIRGRLVFINIERVRELYKRKVAYKELETELGIL